MSPTRLATFAAAAFVAATLSPSTASASQLVAGTNIQVYYNSGGMWGDYGTANGIQIYNAGTWNDVTWPGSPWAQITIEYTYGGVSYNYSNNTSSWSVPVTSEANTSAGSTRESEYIWTPTGMRITKTESWEASGKYMSVRFRVSNTSGTDVTNFRIMHGIDPDQDYDRYFNYSTLNDVRP